MDCDFVAQADTEEEILRQAASHARMVHNSHGVSHRLGR
jgi:predicted small metal-binding protein